ncbi:alpha/beta-hydrolase [Suhomyces tanzawaensis NRRL Y-17324]|uniref:Alpha/beta-hydrolase n=1 Tax=Suhomyces tanzawaensis NRRL Y-17324 TaxID=984487 RepID=A0A1E4SRK8_9ASCO|nr:alpha/beta-hydrolase [Suhomyces tanzawaensis NRRL Y-17324]ODV82140.1 alpha/beta-hydrolase [Suhomyces tanzawaensis NRRL Y-17324]
MIPDASPYYTYSTEVTDAYLHRSPGAYLKNPTPDSPKALKLAYRRYRRRMPIPATALPVNVLFVHGIGMNKGVWHYLIDRLYQRFSGSGKLQISTVIAIDTVNHGESAFANRGRLGQSYDWHDGAFDIIKVATKDEASVFFSQTPKLNILVGHSAGATTALYASAYNQGLFDSCVAINAVVYLGPDEIQLKNNTITEWIYKGFMNSTICVEDPVKYREEVFQMYRRNGFYYKCHPLILKNMVEDEIPSDLTSVSSGDKIQLNTTTEALIMLYFYRGFNNEHSRICFSNINIPVFSISVENDQANTKHTQELILLLKRVHRGISIPKATHMVHAEEPELIVQLLGSIMEERALLNARL